MTLTIEDYKERALDVQLYRVTKKTQEIIQGADVYIAPGTPVDIIASPDGWKLIPAAAY